MPTECPFCGASAAVITGPFAVGPDDAVVAERFSCPECGEEWFTRNQLRALDLSRREKYGGSCAECGSDA